MKQKHLNFRTIIRQSIMLLTAFMLMIPAKAQTYIPPTAYEDTYPIGMPFITRTIHTSNYSFSLGSLGGTPVDIVLSGWDEYNMGGTMAWRILKHGAPSAIFNQGLKLYPNCRDIEVGLLGSYKSPGGFTVLVAYYKNGVGHFVDVYDLTMAGVALLYTMPLSSSPVYTRISMDSHKLYGVAITWQDPSVGYLNTKVGLLSGGLSWSGTLQLPNSSHSMQPDCAFSHTTMAGTLNVHYAYYNPSTLEVIETSADFWTMIYMAGGFAPESVNDLNFVGPVNMPPVNLDCPDHYDVENWAYTYTPNSQDIVVRLMDYHTSASATTTIVNDGSLGNFAINGSLNYNPVVAYDHDCIMGIGTMYVGWYTNNIDPATTMRAGYVALQMDESGTTLLTPTDYLSVANTPSWASGTPFMSFSKQNDMSDYLYTIFPEFNLSISDYQMEHKYHPWNTPSFKNPNKVAYTCNDDEKMSAFVNHKTATPQISAYPNPFRNMLAIGVPADLQNETGNVAITDMTGRICGQFTGGLSEANNYLTTLSKDLAAGNYLLSVNIEGKVKQTLKVTKAN